MSILADKNTRVAVQGITGKTGTFHTDLSLKMGTHVVAGISPGKGGQEHLGVPVFDTLIQAKDTVGSIDATIVYVPAPLALEAITEAVDAGISLIVVITEGIPIRDMLQAKQILTHRPITLIGPNCPGLLVPGQCRLGIIPSNISPVGKIGIVSRSGTLTYEAGSQIAKADLGVSTIVGIGGDPVIGTDFIKILNLFHEDPQTEAILLIGEIGGSMEQEAAEHWASTLKKSKPMFSFIAGKTAPKGKRMGHAGAIMQGEGDSAASKMKILQSHGVTIVDQLTDIGITVKTHLERISVAT